jgi:hypothetical protein
MARRAFIFGVAAGLHVFALPRAHAVIVRHDVDDSAYVVADADYPALVDLFGPGDCIGTLVHESYLLTVAHCAADLRAGDALAVSGAPRVVDEVVLHPAWQDLDAYDVALVRLDGPVTGVTPLPIYRGSSELGAVAALVGRGVTATGWQGEPGAESDGKLRRATNVVSAVNDHFIEIVFEPPGEQGVTRLEGVGAAGDSGAPVFIEEDGVAYLAGLNSYGDADAGVGIGQYRSRDYQTRVSQVLEWLDGLVELPPAPGDPRAVAEQRLDGCSMRGLRGGSGWALGLLAVLAWCRRPGSRA